MALGTCGNEVRNRWMAVVMKFPSAANGYDRLQPRPSESRDHMRQSFYGSEPNLWVVLDIAHTAGGRSMIQGHR